MIKSEVIDGLKERHKNIHPLLFQRSVEHAGTAGELFDILEEIPPYPIMWDENRRRWTNVEDVSLSYKVNSLNSLN